MEVALAGTFVSVRDAGGGDPLNAGDAVRLAAAPADVHLFDMATGARLEEAGR